MFSLLPVSLWRPASTSESEARGSGFKYHFLQIFILNSVEFYRISLEKNSNDIFQCYPAIIYQTYLTVGKVQQTPA